MPSRIEYHNPLITIALPVFNMANTLGRTIDSVRAQTYLNWELLILDDGSTDDSVHVAKKYIDTRIKIVPSTTHLGFAAQLNKAILLANGSYFARIDADDIMFPERLEKQIRFLQKYPSIDLLGTAICLFDESGRFYAEKTFPLTHNELVSNPWNGFLIAHPTWLGKIDWFRKWQYRDIERFEDQDLLLRSHQFSQFANLKEPLSGYYSSKKNLNKQWKARKNGFLVLFEYFSAQNKYGTCLFLLAITILKMAKDILPFLCNQLLPRFLLFHFR